MHVTARFAGRIRAGPTDAEGVCTLRGRDARRIHAEEFGVCYSLGGAVDTVERVGAYLRSHHPSNRAYAGYGELFGKTAPGVAEARRTTPPLIPATAWVTRAIQG